jgi:hypothetical protein
MERPLSSRGITLLRRHARRRWALCGKKRMFYIECTAATATHGDLARVADINRPTTSRSAPRICQHCSLKSQCTTGPERQITRWEHEYLLEAVQQRLDANPQAMRQRRETVEHPFGTMKARMGGNTLPHQNTSKSSRRDGSLGPRL